MRIEANVTHKGERYRAVLWTDLEGDITSSVASLRGPGVSVSGYGESKRMATDKPEPRIGRRYAAKRAVAEATTRLTRDHGVNPLSSSAAGWVKLVKALGREARKHTRYTLLLVHGEAKGPLLVESWKYDVIGYRNAILKVQAVLAKAGVSHGTAWKGSFGLVGTSIDGLTALQASKEFRLVGKDNNERASLPTVDEE